MPPTDRVAATAWNSTPVQRKHASDTLLDLWNYAESIEDEELERVVKDTLDRLGLPWVRLEEPDFPVPGDDLGY